MEEACLHVIAEIVSCWMRLIGVHLVCPNGLARYGTFPFGRTAWIVNGVCDELPATHGLCVESRAFGRGRVRWLVQQWRGMAWHEPADRHVGANCILAA